MMCFWTAVIGYSLEEIQIDLNIRFRDQHYIYAFRVGQFVPEYREESEQDQRGVTTFKSTKWLCLRPSVSYIHTDSNSSSVRVPMSLPRAVLDYQEVQFWIRYIISSKFATLSVIRCHIILLDGVIIIVRLDFVRSRGALNRRGQVTRICITELTIIGSDNGLSPGRRQTIIWTDSGILLIWTLGINFSEIFSEIDTFSFK